MELVDPNSALSSVTNMPANSLTAGLAGWAQCNILVVGDVMLDRYWFGRAERISPEAPVPVVTVDAVEERIGGAGNVARNITALGGQCTLLSVVGDDEAGRSITEIASQANLTPHFVVDFTGRTTVKLRIMPRNQQLLRVDFEAPPAAQALATAFAKFAEVLADHQAVVVSDYGKGGLGNIAQWIELAAKKNIPVLVDPKLNDFSAYRGATMITPNLKEFEQVVGAVLDDADMQRKATHLLHQYQLEQLLVTLSERGMALFSQNREPLRCQARAQDVYDVSGAGDTVAAVMALALAAGLDDRIALELASAAAGIVVSKLGTATADCAELSAAVARNAARNTQ